MHGSTGSDKDPHIRVSELIIRQIEGVVFICDLVIIKIADWVPPRAWGPQGMVSKFFWTPLFLKGDSEAI